ncbi:MAG: rod-binding protein [Treponema sp.]|nr:rod-binding protein [Treponema sp.]
MKINGIQTSGGIGAITGVSASLTGAQLGRDSSDFESLVNSLTGVSSSQINTNHHLNGDYTQGFHGTYTREEDKTALPQGAAANASNGKGKTPVIDRTSELYEQSMELENYLVKTMLSSMRSSLGNNGFWGGEKSYAQTMYEDMLYDNYSEELTKTAGFGLADQIYIELSGQRG